MLLTGYAGQVSLGHAGLLSAGAFTAGILFREFDAPFWVTVPAAALTGALLGVIFGLPSLRLRGLYLAVSTLALHFVVVYLGGEYETKRGFSTGITIDAPRIGGYTIYGGASGTSCCWPSHCGAADLPQPAAQPHRKGLARDPRQRDRRGGARHRGCPHKLLAFVISSSMAAVSGCAVRLLSRFRVGRGVLAVPVDPVRRDDHRGRHGVAARRRSAPSSSRCSPT